MSVTWTGTPSIWIVSPTLSRVVPGMSVTIASSAPASALSSELFPTFGWPARTTRIPSVRSAPWRAVARTAASWAIASARRRRAPARSRNSISSSGKSSVASTSRRSSTIFSASRPISRENAPSRERAADRAAASVLASIRSATASACARSSLSLRKARSVNSPGRARRNPGSRGPSLSRSLSAAASRQRASSSCITIGPPCACNSSTSSPVYECGAGKRIARPRSIGAPWRSRKGNRVAWRGAGARPQSAFARARGRGRISARRRSRRARWRWRWRRSARGARRRAHCGLPVRAKTPGRLALPAS